MDRFAVRHHMQSEKKRRQLQTGPCWNPSTLASLGRDRLATLSLGNRDFVKCLWMIDMSRYNILGRNHLINIVSSRVVSNLWASSHVPAELPSILFT